MYNDAVSNRVGPEEFVTPVKCVIERTITRARVRPHRRFKIEAPNMFVNLGYTGLAVVQNGNATDR